MPIVNEDEQKKGEQLVGQGGGDAYIQGGTGQGATTGVAQAKQPSSSGYVNINRFLDANQQGAAQLGGLVKNDISQNEGMASKSVGDYSTVGSSEAQAGTPSFDAGGVGSSAVDPNLLSQSYSSTPATAVNTGPKEMKVSYGGPSDYTGTGSSKLSAAYGNTTDTMNKANGQLKNYGSFEGTQANLAGITGKDSAFDTAMLQGNQPGYQPYAQNSYNNINSLWEGAKTGVTGNIDSAKTATGNVQGQWDKAIANRNAGATSTQAAYAAQSKKWIRDQGDKAMAALKTPARQPLLPTSQPAKQQPTNYQYPSLNSMFKGGRRYG